MKNLTYADVRKQSTAVFNQFGQSKWIPYAKDNVNLANQRPAEELRGCGVGKLLVSAAMGASLEGKVGVLRQYRERFDLVCCDKAFGVLVEHGVTPDFVMLCDCNIPYDWLRPYADKTAGVKLICTPYANVEWTKRWLGPIYMYVNRDAIESEKHFMPILGEGARTIPASSNVSNAQVVFMTGNDEWDQRCFAGYERILLVGYDYSWRPDGNYYAFRDPRPKRNYMTGAVALDVRGDVVLTSENLLFSARWLAQFVGGWKLPVYNCSGRGLLQIEERDLESELSRFRPDRTARVLEEHGKAEAARREFNAQLEVLSRAREALWR